MSTNPLSQELKTLLGPVTYETLSRNETPMMEILLNPFQEDILPLPETMWYMDESSRGNPATWTAVTVHLNTDELYNSIQILGKVALWLLE